MAIHRIPVEQIEAQIILEPAQTRHLHVMRLQLGQTVQVFDGCGAEATAQITELEDNRAVLACTGEIKQVRERETPQPLTLAIALLKGDKLSEVVRAATELGVAEIQLLVTQHADARDIGAQKLKRLERIAAEASRQCLRSVTPKIHPPQPLSQLKWAGLILMAHPTATAKISEVLHWQNPVTILTGPEGGWAETEIKHLTELGAQTINLGQRVLRAETAPIALLGAIAATGV